MILIGAVLCMAAVSACTRGGFDMSRAAFEPSAPIVVPASEGRGLHTSVSDGAKDVQPGTVVRASVVGGALTAVVLQSDKGQTVPGEFPSRVQWEATQRLAPGQRYRFMVRYRMRGDTAPRTSTIEFATISPRVTATYRVVPDQEKVGVGLPAMVIFDSPVEERWMREQIERAVRIDTMPAQEGAWGWRDDSNLVWRPKTYWKPNTTVKVEAPLQGFQTGADKWVGENKRAAFTVGRNRISHVDLTKHRMTVRENGKVVRTYPVSGGRDEPQYRTRSGIKVITERAESVIMDAATLGIPPGSPGYYRGEYRWAMRVTDTGEFLHANDATVDQQGSANVSHGCVNMSSRNAREMFQESLVGDVVEFTGSSRRMKPGDGMDVWVYSWRDWLTRSATRAAAPSRGE